MNSNMVAQNGYQLQISANTTSIFPQMLDNQTIPIRSALISPEQCFNYWNIYSMFPQNNYGSVFYFNTLRECQ